MIINLLNKGEIIGKALEVTDAISQLYSHIEYLDTQIVQKDRAIAELTTELNNLKSKQESQ